MATTYKEIMAYLDNSEADIIAARTEIENKQTEMKEGFLKNIRDARRLLVFIGEVSGSTKNEEVLKELDELRIKCEEVIETNEAALKEYF